MWGESLSGWCVALGFVSWTGLCRGQLQLESCCNRSFVVCSALLRLQAVVKAAAVWLLWQGEALMLQWHTKLILCPADSCMFYERRTL
jgi:hypothetical protein